MSDGDQKDDCFNATVDCVALTKKNKRKVTNNLLNYIRKHGYNYVFGFSDDLMSNNEIRDLHYYSRSIGLYGYNPIIGFRFSLIESPSFDVGAFITDYVMDNVLSGDYKIDLEPVLEFKKNVDLFNTRLNSEYIERVDLPIFLEDILNLKCLIIVDKKYKDYCKTIEEHLTHYIRENLRINMIERLKDRIEYAKADAIARKTLDSVGIDWRSYPNDNEIGIKHDNEISNAFEIVLRNTKKGSKIEEFSSDYCNGLSFNELCDLFYEDIGWKKFYEGKLDGTEPDLFYEKSVDNDRLKKNDIDENKKLYKRYPNGLLQIQLLLLGEDCDIIEELKGLLSYYKYVVGIDNDIIKKLAKQFNVKYKDVKKIRPNCDEMPRAINIMDCKKSNEIRLEEAPVYHYLNDIGVSSAIGDCYRNYKFYDLMCESEKEQRI